jgi:hypothetical protein
MQTKSLSSMNQMPHYAIRFAAGILVLMLTLLLIVTSVGPDFDDVWVDPRCETATVRTLDQVSAETAVPDCWLVRQPATMDMRTSDESLYVSYLPTR